MDLKEKVQSEYNQGFNHIRNERERKRDILQKLLPTDVPDGQVRINLLWKNLQLERSLFVSDKLNVKAICSDGILGNMISKNSNLVFEYDDNDMELVNMREDIVDYNGLYGCAVTVVDNYDDEEQQPISDTITPLAVIPDPKNWRGSKMRFIGFERKVTKEFLQNAPWYKNIDQIDEGSMSPELRRNEEASNYANNVNDVVEQEGLIDIYDHFTTFKGKKILSTWANDRELCIREVEIEPLTNAEKLNPSKIQYPVQIHRRKNKPGCFFGVSIADEVLAYQDAITQLANLNLLNARISALWPDKIVDSNLGIDLAMLADKKPGGRYIPADAVNGQSIGNSIYTDMPLTPSQYPMQQMQALESYQKQITGAGDIAFGDSPQGTQTKAEIQTLMSNSTQLLSSVWDNYLRGIKGYYLAHYRSYALNMGKKDKKIISMFQKWDVVSLTLSKEDFIADGKVQIYIESQNQVDKQNEKNSAKLLALQWVYLPYLTSEYARNKFLRLLGNMQGIRGFEAESFIFESVDETRARQRLELLNRGEDVSPPMPWEDFQTYLDIYKQAIDTPATMRAIFMYQQALIMQEEMLWQTQVGTGDEQVKNIAMNQLSQQQNNNPNTSQAWI